MMTGYSEDVGVADERFVVQRFRGMARGDNVTVKVVVIALIT